MSKRRRRSDDEAGERSTRSRRRRHYLYFVVDDWTKGYSIHKVDVSEFDSAHPGADLDSQASHLPSPPVFRLECSGDHPPEFAAVGSRITAMGYSEDDEDAPVLLYDTATGGLAVGPRVPAEVNNAPTFVPAWGKLYVMDNGRWDEGREHFAVLAADEKGHCAWNFLRLAPFEMWRVTCHAAHPDGRRIFFSAQGNGTYSFDTETHEWKRHGDWMLPFEGHAYYDGEVDAWVGLHGGDSAEPGTVCSCDVVPVGPGEGGRLPPAWKLAREKMVCEDAERVHGVALTPMGRGKFCLVEHRCRKGVPADVLDAWYLFYATTFKVRYDKDGGLRATARRTRSYTVPRESSDFNWWVFGI